MKICTEHFHMEEHCEGCILDIEGCYNTSTNEQLNDYRRRVKLYENKKRAERQAEEIVEKIKQQKLIDARVKELMELEQNK